MGARAFANLSVVVQGKRLALFAYARFWHPSRMQSSAERVSGGRFPCGPKTTTDYPLPTLRVGLAGRNGSENLTPAALAWANPSLMQPCPSLELQLWPIDWTQRKKYYPAHNRGPAAQVVTPSAIERRGR
jgi:hypothetical protein